MELAMNKTKLIRQLAEKGMGWEVVENLKGGILTFYDRNKKLILGWNPLTDWNDCMGLVGEMRSKRWKFGLTIGSAEDKKSATFWKSASGQYCHGREDKAKTAICMAAAKALDVE